MLLEKIKRIEETLHPPVVAGQELWPDEWPALIELVNLLPEIREYMELNGKD